MTNYGLPPRQGLYDPRLEHDACGIGFVADIKGRPSHGIVEQGVEVLVNLTHRGACGCDPDTGDGAGLLLQIPHKFFVKRAAANGFSLPPLGEYGVGMIFVSPQENQGRSALRMVEEVAEAEGLRVIAWRRVPTYSRAVGWQARETEPHIYQVFIEQAGGPQLRGDAWERKLFIFRKHTEQESERRQLERYYPATLSSRTICYKGLLLAPQIFKYYPDLSDSDFQSAVALIHQRFSTNTFPTWERAQPFRYLAHNGEINTLRGNANWMRAREATLQSELFGSDTEKIKPIIDETGSDSTQIDNALEVLIQSGRSTAHSFMMLIPEAWSSHEHMEDYKKEFYEFHATMMEPWDGPASIVFTDGRYVGGSLDRNGLRPSRYTVTHDDLVVMGSETGVIPEIQPGNVRAKGRLQPGRMFLVDMQEGRIIRDEEIKETISRRKPYGKWLRRNLIHLGDLPAPPAVKETDFDTLLQRQRSFGYTVEHQRILLRPMARSGEEPIGSMGIDIPLACLSERPQLLFSYFKQLFAQVTNPAIDPIREELVMSTVTYLGPQGNLLDERPEYAHVVKVPAPVIDNAKLEMLRALGPSVRFGSRTFTTTFPVADGPQGLKRALDRLCEEAESAADAGASVLVLSDRGVDEQNAPIPSLLACAGVHHHLIRRAKRSKVGIVVESGEPREVMHFCLLIGYGANAVNAYLAYETIEAMHARGQLDDPALSVEKAHYNFEKAIRKGTLKVMSKMGISTVQSYHGAQIFRSDRARRGARRPVFHRHDLANRRRRLGDAGGRSAREAPLRLPAAVGGLHGTVGRRGIPVPIAGRAAPAQSRYGDAAPARGPAESLVDLRGLLPHGQRPEPPALHAARPVRPQACGRAGPAGRGGAGDGHRQALLHWRHELRIDFGGGPRDAGAGHEPYRRALEHGRRWRGPRTVRGRSALQDQASRVGALRGDRPLPVQR